MCKNRNGINSVSKNRSGIQSVSKNRNGIQVRRYFLETEFNSVAIFRNGMYSVSIIVYILRNKIPLFLETEFL